jgi:hypothetical protein
MPPNNGLQVDAPKAARARSSTLERSGRGMGTFFAITLAAIVLVSIAGTTKHLWVQYLVGSLFLVTIAIYSIWILIIAWALAAFGLVMVLCGVIWRFLAKPPSTADASIRSAHPSGGLIYPGLGLVAAPIANILIVMPIARANPDIVRFLIW